MPFKLTEDRINNIANKFEVNAETVKKVNEIFTTKIVPTIEDQYLAHICRALEVYLRNNGEDDSFTIRLKKIPNKSGSRGRIQYIKAREGKSPQYMIHYYEDIDPKEKRVIISHELGHILFSMIVKNLKEESTDLRYDLNQMNNVEPHSSLLGFLALMDRSQFYSDGAKKFTHLTFDKLLADFCLLHNGKES